MYHKPGLAVNIDFIRLISTPSVETVVISLLLGSSQRRYIFQGQCSIDL
jgi:hypothetical protein